MKKSPLILLFLALMVFSVFLLRKPKFQAQIIPFPLGHKSPTVTNPSSVTNPVAPVGTSSYFMWPLDFPRTNISDNDNVLNVLTGELV